MRTAVRLAAGFFGLLLVVVALQTGWSVFSDWRAAKRDLHRDHRLMGTALAGAVGKVWAERGREEAEALLLEAGVGEVEFTLLERLPSRGADEPLPEEEVRQRITGEELVTRVPISTTAADEGLAWLEITEPVRSPASFIQRSALPALLITLFSAVLYGLLAMSLVMRGAARRAGIAEQRAQEAVDELRHANRLATVGQVAASLAHELGTPLSIISGRAQMLARGRVDDDNVQGVAQIIADEGQRLATMIRQLLDFSRRSPHQKETFDVAERMRAWAQVLEPLAKRESVVLEVDANKPAMVSGQASQAQQVLTNLIVNAIHASSAGGRVAVEVTEAGGEVVVRVEDDGVGMTPEVLERAFTPFFTTKDEGAGTGLGLAVARDIVKDMGGTIELTSKPGVGTQAVVRWPKA